MDCKFVIGWEILGSRDTLNVGRTLTDSVSFLLYSNKQRPWNFSETTFSNEYFRLLVEERWSPKLTHNGQPWDGPDQYGKYVGCGIMMMYGLYNPQLPLSSILPI